MFAKLDSKGQTVPKILIKIIAVVWYGTLILVRSIDGGQELKYRSDNCIFIIIQELQ